MPTFAEKLREVRKARDFTQDRLSKEMNVSRQTISHWENGRAVPDIDTIKHLSQVLNYNFLAVEGLTEEPQSTPVKVETPLRETNVPEVKPAHGKRKLWVAVIGSVLVCMVLLGVFIMKMDYLQTGTGHVGSDTKGSVAQKANVIITPLENPVPLMIIEDFPDGYGWLYEVVMEETAGVPFTAKTLTQAIVYENGMEYPNNFVVDHIIPAWGGDTLYKGAPRNWRGGIPTQPEPVKAIRLILHGTDANGNEVEAECTIELLNQTAE